MKSAYLRICRLLAASGFRESEIAEFSFELAERHPRRLLEDISQIRRQLLNPPSNRIRDIPSDHFEESPGEVEKKVEQLLLHDAGMSKAFAIEQLTEALNARYPTIQLPPESRKGFAIWIRKLRALVPERELLYIATSLRNRLVHDAPSDWRLK